LPTTAVAPDPALLALTTILADLPANCFEVIGAGDQATAKKPAPDIFRWVLNQPGLARDACLAIKDSKNGVCAALGAGIPALVTESFRAGRDDFTGAMAVLPDLEGIGLARPEQSHAQAST
jgi:beta-phosphoglucomutase-like phosphatase (HAD superfamily)